MHSCTTTSAPPVYRHKRGDSIILAGPWEHDGGSDFTGWTARSQIRDGTDAVVAEFVFTWLDIAAGHAELRLMDSSALTIGRYSFDVEFTAPDGSITSSDTATLIVERDVTR